MLQVLIHDKIGRWLIKDKNPWEIEDLLTAVVLGSCEYAGLDGWTLALQPFLAEARDAPRLGSGRKLTRLLPPAERIKDIAFHFWPSFPAFEASVNSPTSSPSVSIDAAIPEVIIRLNTSDGRSLFILIEVKLNVGKSAGASPSVGKISDQLAKYWKHLRKVAEGSQGEALAVVYVTPWSFPREEMAETRDELAKIGEINAPIFWISWRDFVPAVRRNAQASQRSLPAIIRDVCELMENRWGFFRAEIETWPIATALVRPRVFSIDWQGINLCWIGAACPKRPFVFTFEPLSPTCADIRVADWQFSNGERTPK